MQRFSKTQTRVCNLEGCHLLVSGHHFPVDCVFGRNALLIPDLFLLGAIVEFLLRLPLAARIQTRRVFDSRFDCQVQLPEQDFLSVGI